MLKNILHKLENPKRPLLGPNVKALQFWGLLLPKNVYKKYFYIFMHGYMMVFITTEFMEMWIVRSDMNLFLFNLKLTMPATVNLIKATTFVVWQKNWQSVIDYVTDADLYQRRTTDPKKLELVNTFTKYCRKLTYLFWSLMFTTIIIMVIQPIYKYTSSETYRANVKNGTETYIPIVSSWVPFDENTLVGYLGASFLQISASIHGGGWLMSFDTNAIVIMVFFRVELELLRIDCRNIFGEETAVIDHEVVMSRLKDCHRRHINLLKFSRVFDSCFSPIMMFYMVICSIMLCISAYQITNETDPMQRLLTAQFLVFAISQIFIYCWHSNDVMFASLDLSRGPYESIWWCKDVKYRKDICLLVTQFDKIVVFSAGPFTNLTVSSFINILKGAYSYYTLLSQSEI